MAGDVIIRVSILADHRKAPCSVAHNDYITAVYRRHAKTIYRLCLSFLGNCADAEDATQTVFLKLIRNPRSFQDVEHEKAWLIVCAQNHCRDILKSADRTRKSEFREELGAEAAPEGRRDLREAIYSLPDKYKTCVYLYYYEGYRSKEIAQMVSLPDSTVRSHLSEARKLLRRSLQGHDDEPR